MFDVLCMGRALHYVTGKRRTLLLACPARFALLDLTHGNTTPSRGGSRNIEGRGHIACRAV